MAKLSRAPGSTSQSIQIFIRDSSVTTGAGLTGLAFNTSSLTAYYVRPAGTATAITLATQTAGGAWSSGGFVAIDGTNMPGMYRLDVPDAALASGADSVVIMLKGAANMSPCTAEIDLKNDSNVVSLIPVGGVGALAGAGIIDIGTAQSATSTTLVLRSAASFANSELVGAVAVITGGTGVGQSRVITGNVGATDTITVDAWTTTPSGTITYVIFASPPASATALPAVNTTQFAGQTVTAATGVTLPSSVASPTNITAGTITTVTNLTNAPTAGDLTATMKTSVTTAATAATPTAAAVTGAVGSVTGNIGGNVVGSVGSVTALAANSVNANALATDAITEIQTGLATSSALSTANTAISAVKAKTDSLTFTVGNVVDANLQYINDVVVTGNGSSSKFGV
jgi:hypothetical protein